MKCDKCGNETKKAKMFGNKFVCHECIKKENEPIGPRARLVERILTHGSK
jgi:ribosomal protein S27E